jgi:hypothetical protein
MTMNNADYFCESRLENSFHTLWSRHATGTRSLLLNSDLSLIYSCATTSSAKHRHLYIAGRIECLMRRAALQSALLPDVVPEPVSTQAIRGAHSSHLRAGPASAAWTRYGLRMTRVEPLASQHYSFVSAARDAAVTITLTMSHARFAA